MPAVCFFCPRNLYSLADAGTGNVSQVDWADTREALKQEDNIAFATSRQSLQAQLDACN